jgi:hypothetical protein
VLRVSSAVELLLFCLSGRGRRARRRRSFSTSETESDDELVAANRGFRDLPRGSTSSLHAVQTAADDVHYAFQNDNDLNCREASCNGVLDGFSKPSALGSCNAASNGFQRAVSDDTAYRTVSKGGVVIPSSGSREALQRAEDFQREEALTKLGRTNALKGLVVDTSEVLSRGVAAAAVYNEQSTNYDALQSVMRGDQTGSAAQLFLNASFRGSVSKQLSGQIAKLLMELDASKDLNIQVTYLFSSMK